MKRGPLTANADNVRSTAVSTSLLCLCIKYISDVLLNEVSFKPSLPRLAQDTRHSLAEKRSAGVKKSFTCLGFIAGWVLREKKMGLA